LSKLDDLLSEIDAVPQKPAREPLANKFYRIEPFNPDSTDQVQDLARHFKVKLPRRKDSDDEEALSTEKKYLKQAAKKHPVFGLILECRERNKMLSTYNWVLDTFNRVHTVLGHHPSTWRKCVARGTMIEIVRDVSKAPFGVPIEKVKVGDLAYTYDSNGKLTLKPVLWVGPTGVKKVIRLHWISMGCHTVCGFLDVTPDHMIRLTDGSYKEAKDIKITYGRRKRTGTPGDKVLSLHRGPFIGRYSRLTGEGIPSGSTMLDHRFIYETLTGNVSEHVHHRNGNGLDNRPENLLGMSASEHTTMEAAKRYWTHRPKNNHRIVAIEELNLPTEVWDMEVQDTHCFIANDLCVHNSSRDYNLQNIPKRSDLATEFRRMVVAPVGHRIIEADSSAIEAVLVGYLARSERYITLAKCGIHDWFNAVVHGEGFSSDLPFDELRSLCKAAKARYSKESREVSKRTIHLTAYYGTPIRMNDEYPNEFPTVAIARRFQNMLLATPPGEDLQRWWKETHARAAHDKFLSSPFGGRHRFFSIYTYNKRSQQWEPRGDDAKRAIAYLPQHSASMLQDIYVDSLWKGPVGPYMRLPIHDSVLSVAPAGEAPDVAKAMFNTFQMPIEELGGLMIGAEVSMSGVTTDVMNPGNWAPRSADNPLGMEAVSF
jgi:DNA polymerase family A/HNH endonuclease